MFYKIKGYALYFGVFCVFSAFLLLLYFAFIKRSMMMYGGKICVADFLDSLTHGFFINLLVVPFSAVLITAFSERHCTTANYYLRRKKRFFIISNQLMKILFSSVFISVLFAAVSTVIAGLFTSVFINWREYGSFFYISRGVRLDISFINVLTVITIKLFFPILFFSLFVCMVSLVTKKIFSFIAVIALSAMNFFGLIKYMIDSALPFNETEISYLSLSSRILLFVVFPLLIAVIAALSFKLVKRKDFLVT